MMGLTVLQKIQHWDVSLFNSSTLNLEICIWCCHLESNKKKNEKKKTSYLLKETIL